MDTCIFRKILNGSAPAHKIWENKNFFAFLDTNPVNPGHTMIIPKHHIDYVFDLEEPLYTELFRVTKELSEPIKRAMQASRIGVVIEGFRVSHLHVHLVPINGVNELDPTRAKRATAQELAVVAVNIAPEAYETFKNKKDGCIKVVLKPWQERTPGKVQSFPNELKPDAPSPSPVAATA